DLAGVGLVVRRADMVWLAGEQLHPVAQIVGVNTSVEVAFERGLTGRRRRSEGHAHEKKAPGREQDDSAQATVHSDYLRQVRLSPSIQIVFIKQIISVKQIIAIQGGARKIEA